MNNNLSKGGRERRPQKKRESVCLFLKTCKNTNVRKLHPWNRSTKVKSRKIELWEANHEPTISHYIFIFFCKKNNNSKTAFDSFFFWFSKVLFSGFSNLGFSFPYLFYLFVSLTLTLFVGLRETHNRCLWTVSLCNGTAN